MLQNITSGSYKSLEAQQVGNVPVITERWRNQVLYEWNNSRAYFPNACTHELLGSNRWPATPSAVAIFCKDRQLRYWELNQSANHVAHYLQRRGVQADS
jgi:non-ribosomal peptide synthetase component E (peptide arylation enzyme)